ncbi:MAG: hypothetical protein P3W87_003300, partial [Gammaproteobacteria bacterium]|nr:hypothetical protein [Gammaproteobacteria bacterium]
MTTLALFVPGLLGPWPAEIHPPKPHAPTLRRMLARGDRLTVEPLGFEGALARLFGYQGEDLPWAALGLWGEMGQRPEGYVLRLDPVHLKLGMTDAIVFGGPSLRLSIDEARALAASVESHFQDLGWRLTVAASERWYLQTPQAFDLVTTPLTRAVGRDAGLFKPGGADATRWLAWLTEIQMLLHAHPVNEAREAKGLLTINHLWAWGAGMLGALSIGGMDITLVHADHPLARGLAHAAALPVYDLPERLSDGDVLSMDAGHSLVVLDDTLQPWLDGDHEDWLATVEGLEACWFAPLWQAMARGQVSELILDAAQGGRWRFKRMH